MNRVVVLGAAAFLALVGFAMLGETDKAIAGHGCSGCSGEVECSGDDCCGGLFARLRAKMATRCCGEETDCSGEAEEAVETTCSGEAEDCSCSGRRSLFSCHGRDRCSGRTRCSGSEECSGRTRCSGRERCSGRMSLRNRCSGEKACPPTCCG